MRSEGASCSRSSPSLCWGGSSQVLLRAANRPRCVASAQALALGALEAAGKQMRELPVEVLVQRGEDLVPQMRPSAEGFPSPSGERKDALEAELAQLQLAVQPGALAESLTAAGFGSGSFDDVDLLSEALACVEALDATWGGGATQALPPADALAALRRLRFLRWAGPLQAAASPAEAAGAVLGPLLRELFGVCDAVLEQASSSPSLVVYAAEASSLACLEGALGAVNPAATWPSFAESLEVELIEVDGEARVALRRAGRDLFGPGVFSYGALRERFEDVLSTEEAF